MKIYVKGVNETSLLTGWTFITMERYFRDFSMDLCAVATQEEIDMINGAALIFGTEHKPNLLHLYPLTYQGAICRVDMPEYFLKVVL